MRPPKHPGPGPDASRSSAGVWDLWHTPSPAERPGRGRNGQRARSGMIRILGERHSAALTDVTVNSAVDEVFPVSYRPNAQSPAQPRPGLPHRNSHELAHPLPGGPLPRRQSKPHSRPSLGHPRPAITTPTRSHV
jgi:hypothetical protein